MVKLFGRLTLIGGILAAGSIFGADPDVKHEATRIGAWIDVGQVVKGKVDNDVNVDMNVVTRSKVALSQQATVNERLKLTGAVGGLFFYSLPLDKGGAHTRLLKFTAVLEEASAHYKMGDIESPWFDTRFGLFFEKYNPDAKNLGEYLFRSGTYPGYLQTGGWYILNSAGYMMQGIKTSFHLLDNTLHPEFLLSMERDYEPAYDLTPAFMLTYKPSPVFEAGVGVAFNHLISAKPSFTKAEDGGNAYISSNGKDSIVFIKDWERVDSIPGVDFYTFQGTKAVARASVNFQSMLESDLLNPQDLKIYGELAVLGIKDYPLYYTNIMKRMPMMVGLNLPTFKLVDKMSFEFEYYNSDFPNSLEEVYERLSATPGLGTLGGPGTPQRQQYLDSLGTHRNLRDKVKWTFWLQKEVMPGLGLTFQMASDHFRPMNFNLKPSYEPVTRTWNDWYYMFRVGFGI